MSALEKVLLVYPRIPRNTYWSFDYTLKIIGKRGAMPPLSLVTIASMFPRNRQIKLIDMNIEPLTREDILWADAVFLSGMIVQKESFHCVVKQCNALSRPVVAGGPYATTCWRQISGVDHFILGEAESIFSEFLSDFESGKAKKRYFARKRPDLASVASPRFDLLDLSAYTTMSIQYSRGCPFKCEFCDIWTLYGKRARVKSARQVIAELDILHELGWRGTVFIVDDNFIGNKRRVKAELLPELIRWQRERGHPFRFFTEASINLASDDELIAAMYEAGFNDVFIGIETPSKKALRETGKTQNLGMDMSQAVKKLQKNGLEVMAGFILGFDSDTEDIFDRQIEFIRKAAIPKAMIGVMIALPETRLFERLEREGRILAASDGNNTHSLETNFITRMDPKTLKDGYKRVLENLYDYRLKNYFDRCSRLLDSIEKKRFFQRQVHTSDLRILFHSLRHQIFTPYGFEYLKFLGRALIKNRPFFAEAVRMAVQGHHFHGITRRTLRS